MQIQWLDEHKHKVKVVDQQKRPIEYDCFGLATNDDDSDSDVDDDDDQFGVQTWNFTLQRLTTLDTALTMP